MYLTDRELATTLAALRWWQVSTDEGQRAYDTHIAHGNAGTPLSDVEIDELCERLNMSPRE